LMCRWC